LDWLSVFPLEHTAFVLYIKGELKKCNADIPVAIRSKVLQCIEMENFGGREAHSMVHFIVYNWHSLPHLTHFDLDVNSASDERHKNLASLTPTEFETWVEGVETDPFRTIDTCMCNIVLEKGIWKDDGHYGYYNAMSWFMETFLEMNTTGVTNVRWPSGAQLVVPKWAVRSRPITVYRVILELLSGRMPSTYNTVTEDTRLVHKNLATLHWAHILERLWFSIFDVAYMDSL